MNQYQKKVLFIVFSILIFIAIVAVVWSLFINNESDPGDNPQDPSNPTEPGNNEGVFRTEISALNDYNEFFTVSKIINNYYLDITSSNKENVLALLDEDYKKEMGIQVNNVFDIIRSDYTSVTFTPMEIYYNADSIVTYYFVNGYIEDVDFIENSSLYDDSINFLVILNKNTRHYVIVPLHDNIDIEEYAMDYELVEKELAYNTYSDVKTTTETVLITYLNVFRDLLFLDNDRAYNMLRDNTKKQYSNKQDFYLHQQDIYDYVPSSVFGYSQTKENDLVVYRIHDDERNEFVIYEKKIMNFQISY